MSFETPSFGRDDNETTDKSQVETGGEDDHINPEQEDSLERFDPEELKEVMDTGKVEILERSAAEIAEIEQDIAAVEADEAATQEQKESTIFSLNQLKETVKRVTSQYGHRLKHYGLISLVLFSSFGKMKPPERFQPAGPEEPLTAWNHEDYHTQNILNRMASDGIPQIPTKSKFLKQELANHLINKPEIESDEQVNNIISDVENRSYDGLLDLALEEGLIDSRSESEISDFITESFTFSAHKQRAEREYREYRAIWEMHKEHGNPKIRIDTSTDRAYYVADTNTMYITSDAPVMEGDMSIDEYRKVVEDWVAELSHSKQYTEKGEDAFEQREKDIQTAKEYADKHGVPYSDARDSTLYHTPGTNEFEAHQEIEPELEKELKQRTRNTYNKLSQESDSQTQTDG